MKGNFTPTKKNTPDPLDLELFQFIEDLIKLMNDEQGGIKATIQELEDIFDQSFGPYIQPQALKDNINVLKFFLLHRHFSAELFQVIKHIEKANSVIKKKVFLEEFNTLYELFIQMITFIAEIVYQKKKNRKQEKPTFRWAKGYLIDLDPRFKPYFEKNIPDQLRHGNAHRNWLEDNGDIVIITEDNKILRCSPEALYSALNRLNVMIIILLKKIQQIVECV